MAYLAVSFYKFVAVENPEGEVARHKEFVDGRDLTGRVYISEEGINAQFSGSREVACEYMEWVVSDPRFAGTSFKVQEHPEHAFPRMTIKCRPLVALGCRVDMKKGGERVSPKRWREMMESGEYLLLDVRNDYEWDVGHFKNSRRPECRTFRDFPAYARRLCERYDPKRTKVMMCCTGGIRCEVYSALMKEEGFEEVYQLDGGILNYAKEENGKHWDGKLFVFDDRLAVDVNPEAEVVGHCHHCGDPAEQFYNCADMDCNQLFLCCGSCLEANKGCCSTSCQSSERLRPLSHQDASKPFRRWHSYFHDKRGGSRGSCAVCQEERPSVPA